MWQCHMPYHVKLGFLCKADLQLRKRAYLGFVRTPLEIKVPC